MFVVDLDMTLLRSDTTLSDFTIRTLNELIQREVRIIVATARSFEKMRALTAQLELRDPAIVLNGAMIVGSNGELLQQHFIPSTVTNALISQGQRSGLLPFINGRSGGRDIILYSSHLNPGQEMFLQHRSGDPRLRHAETLTPLEETLMLLFIGGRGELEAIRKSLCDVSGPEYATHLAPDPYCLGYFTLEVRRREANKAAALTWLMQHLQEDLRSTTVFGDHLNDLDLFHVAGKRIAVGNAQPEVKAASDLVIATNDQDGVARYLAEIFALSK